VSLKDCLRIVKTLDPADRDSFNTEFERLTRGGIKAEDAYMEAAEYVMDVILIDRNVLAGEINEAGGYLEILKFEHLVNPKSYEQGSRGGAADIGKMSADEFDALLEDAAPAPVKDTPAPKEPAPEPPADVTTAESAIKTLRAVFGNKTWKNRATVKRIRETAKALGMKGYSKKGKAEIIRDIEDQRDIEAINKLPPPYEGEKAASSLRAAYYSHANSSLHIVANSEDPAFGAWAQHYGASVLKKADTYDGNKTDKGYHFEGTLAFEKFVADYAGRQMRDYESNMHTEGQLTSVPYEPVPIEDPVFEKGDKVEIVPDMPDEPVVDGEIWGEITIAKDGPASTTLEGYMVRYEDPESGKILTEKFHPSFLRKKKPPSKKARAALKAAAKHGVKGADEALTGLVNLFGGKGKFSSGLSFDEETYAKAKPHFKKALEEFVAAGKSLKDFVQFIVENMGEGIKLYLKRFHQDIADGNITVRGVNDVQPTAQESDTTGESRTEPADSVDIEDAGTSDAEVSAQTGVGLAEEESAFDSSIGIPVDSPVDVGEQSDTDILGDTGEFEPATGVTGHQDGRRGNVAGAEGVSAETPGDQQVKAAALSTSERLKLRPTTDTWIASDPANIAETLPILFPEQQDDVMFAEQRLFDNGHRGVMFTNGTGTGKTFNGLGIAKRFVMQGKDNILIVVPGEKIASDWIKSGKLVQLGITKLKNIKDSGTGVVITTYANLSENNEIPKRVWDLVIHDEAHKLSENMAGNATNALNKSRAVTGHPDGAWAYAAAMESELLDKMQGLKDQIKHLMAEAELKPEQAGTFSDTAEKISDELDELNIIWRERSKAHVANRAELWEANTTKRLDLTATPFAYEKSVDHAEGFLFEYDRSTDQTSRGYNTPDSRGSFMVEHFGYRMRYGKLTEPEADVDRGLMQREFNQWLKKEGALRGRVLTVDHDYSREFIAIDDLVGKKIDDGWDTIRARSMDKNNPNMKGYELMEKALRKQFNYHARVRMLEAIKARFAVKRANQHMAMGRKVVLFHSRIQGGTMNPFHIFAGAAAAAELDVVSSDEEAALYQAAANEFVNERHDLMTLDINTVRPLDLFEQEWGEKMTLYNGRITNKQKRENPDRFNSDGEEVHVIAVQDEGGKEGISLHDATGANQRVLINLGLPVRPTQAIQIEGRIYRVGQQSNAIFEYFNTGTNFERMTFAEKISERASTAENLAMGEQARTLKDSFIDAYEDPSFLDPSEAQGVGGKEIDRANWAATSEFERAKTHYFGTLKTKGRRDQRAGMDYFATPEPLGVKMVEWAGVKPNDSVLEPSAGHGAIARYFPDNVSATFVEPSSELISKLALRAPGNHRQMNFEDLDVGGNKYNSVVMNPPFGSGGATAIAHLHKAMHHLKNGGRVVALIPEGPAADKKFDNMFYGKEGELDREGGSVADETRRIEDLTKYHLRASISLPPVTFTRAGTAVRARVVVIDKILNSDAAIVSQPPRELHADTIKELFEKIEDMVVPDRAARSEEPSDYLANEGIVVTHDEENGVWRLLGKTFDHRSVIKRALGDDVEWSGGAWVATVDPVMPLYTEMTKPIPQEAPAASRAAPVWVKQDYQEYKSTDASINKTLNPVTIGIVEKNYGWLSGTINADLGGGMHNNTIEYMESIGVEHVVYDPFNRSDEHNSNAVAKIRDGKANTVTINNTLNVIKEPELRKQLLLEANNALKPGGQLYIQIYEGDKTGIGRHTKGDIWQENRKAGEFLTEIQTVFPNAEIKYGLISAQKFITAVKPDMASAAAALFSGRSGQLPNAPSAPSAQFTTAETTHAKKGIDLFVASIAERVERPRYVEILAVAKQHGGYYSAFKGRGAIPGFQFESEESRAAFIAEIDGQRPLASRRGRTVPGRRNFLKYILGAAVGAGGMRLGVGPADNTTLGRAQPVSDNAATQALPPAAEKILRADGSLPKALRIIGEEGPKELRALATMLSRLIPKGVIKIVVDEKTIVNYSGAIIPRNNGAVMTLYTAGRSTGLDVGTVLHESLHAAVSARYYKLSVATVQSNYRILGMTKPKAVEAINQLSALWREFTNSIDTAEITNTSLLAAYNSPDEFFVRALTDPTVQAFMAAREYKGRTLRERFVDWVKFHLFGYERAGEIPSWLDAALMASDDVIEAMKGDDPNFDFNDAVIREVRGKPLASLASRPGDEELLAIIEGKNEFALRQLVAEVGRMYPKGELSWFHTPTEAQIKNKRIAELAQQRVDGMRGKALIDRRTGGSTVSSVKSWLAAPLKRISSRVPVEIVQRVDQIPTTYELVPDAKGYFINNKVYLVAENLYDKLDAEIALTHEVIGHLGTEGVLGRKKMNELIGDISNMKLENIFTPGTHVELARILGILRENYVDEQGNYTLSPVDEAKEIIAHIAESKPRIGTLAAMYNKVMLWIKQFLSKLGLANVDMLKIEDALIRAADFVKDPPSYYTGAGLDGLAAMRKSPEMVVAARTPGGEVWTGQTGDLHFNMADRYNLVGEDAEMGFVDITNPEEFLSREEAFAIIRAERPDWALIDKREDGELDSLDIVDIEDTGYTIEYIQEQSEALAMRSRSSPQLIVAAQTKSGEVIIGEPGQIHASLLTPENMEIIKPGE